MTSLALSAPGSPVALKRRELAKQINALHEAVTIRLARVRRDARDCVVDAGLAGKALIAAKATVRHGDWLDWLAASCPTLPYELANRYMLLARHWERHPGIEDSASIDAALKLCANSPPPTGNSHTAQQWPPFINGIKQVARATGYIARHPVAEWPEEGREQLRGELTPLASALWPEKFM